MKKYYEYYDLQALSTLIFSFFITFILMYLNPIQDGSFPGCSWIRVEGGVAKRLRLQKMCHIYLTMMKLGSVIPCLKKIQKMN